VSDHPAIDLSTRLALRPNEAAMALGISERTLRGLLPELPHVRCGGVVMIPVKPLEDWLKDRSKAEQSATDEIADGIMSELTDD
jgi:hypothetical protein